jgi:hypothetical protein
MAMAVIGVGLVAVMLGFSYGTTGTETGRQQTMAVFLAEQRVEAMRSIAVNMSNPNAWADPQLAPGTTAEAYGTIPNAAKYRRVTTITNAAGPAPVPWKRVQVDVFYRPITERGSDGQERQLTLVSVISRRQ